MHYAGKQSGEKPAPTEDTDVKSEAGPMDPAQLEGRSGSLAASSSALGGQISNTTSIRPIANVPSTSNSSTVPIMPFVLPSSWSSGPPIIAAMMHETLGPGQSAVSGVEGQEVQAQVQPTQALLQANESAHR